MRTWNGGNTFAACGLFLSLLVLLAGSGCSSAKEAEVGDRALTDDELQKLQMRDTEKTEVSVKTETKDKASAAKAPPEPQPAALDSAGKPDVKVEVAVKTDKEAKASFQEVYWPKDATVNQLRSLRYWKPERIRDTIAVLEDPEARPVRGLDISPEKVDGYRRMAFGLKIFMANTGGDLPNLDYVALSDVFNDTDYTASSPMRLLLPENLAMEPTERRVVANAKLIAEVLDVLKNGPVFGAR